MQIEIIIILLGISIILALISFHNQTKLQEIKKVKHSLKKGKVIYDASDKLSDFN